MATTTAFTNTSATPPSIPLICKIPTKCTLQTLPSSSSSSSSSVKLRFEVIEDSLTISVATSALALASAASQAAKDVVSSASAQVEIPVEERLEFRWDNDRIPARRDEKNQTSKQRRRRRRRKVAESSMAESTRQGMGLFEIGGKKRSFRPHNGYLTVREEAEFSLCLKEGARLEATRRRMCETRKQDPTLSQWAEAMGMKQVNLEKMLWRTRECSRRIIMSYRRLVFSIASTYQGRGLSLQDLVQEGNIGLLRGAERFDHRKGHKLSTYVYWWIKQSIIKAIAVKSRTVRLPGSTCGAVAKIAEATTLLSKKLGRVPSYDEVSDLVGIGVSRVRLVSERSRNPVSIDQPFTTDGNITLKDIIPGPEERSLEAMVTREFMKEDVEGLLKTLSKREERIVRLYFGFDGETARSCEEIGRLLNLSRERVRQLHCSALTKLREHSMTDGLRQLYMVQQ